MNDLLHHKHVSMNRNTVKPGLSQVFLAAMLMCITTTPTRAAAPFAHTQATTLITSTNAQLGGMVLPNGESTFAWFEWGVLGNYSSITPPMAIGTGSCVVRATNLVMGLTNGGVYQCRLVASNASGVATGGTHLFTTGNKLAIWGAAGTYPDIPSGVGHDVVGVATGERALALLSGGSIFEWRSLNGVVMITNVYASFSNIVAVAASDNCFAALDGSGTAYRWMLGCQPTNPTAISSNTIAIAVGCGSGCAGIGGAVSESGIVSQWNYAGNLLAPIPTDLSNVVAVSCGALHFLALRADGTVAAWGKPAQASVTNVPPGLSNVIGIAAGLDHNAVLKKDGTVVAWGQNNMGQTNVPIGLSNVVSLSAGTSFTLAVRADGTVVGWGRPGYADVPTGLSRVSSVSANLGASMKGNIAISENLPPIVKPGSLQFTGYVNHDLTIQLPAGYDANSDVPLTHRVTSLPTSGTLYQYNAGSRGAEITSANAEIVDTNHRVIFSPLSDSIGTPYTQFQFTVNDNETNSTPASRNIHIVLPAAPQIDGLLSGPNSNGGFGLIFSGTAQATYRVWGSSNLLEWELLGQATSPSNGWFNYVDAAMTNSPQRFYKAGAP
jgi:hypothetical protein